MTDSSEGTGGGNTHTVDNSGRDNYVLFEFSETVIVDSAFLGYVVGDSDLTVWIGSTAESVQQSPDAQRRGAHAASASPK